jgi:hypothetical protein
MTNKQRPPMAGHRGLLDPAVLDAMRAALHEVSGRTIEAVVAEVPGYGGTLDEPAQATLAQAVELALKGFLSLAAEESGPATPLAPALDGAYALGRGEARAGRSMDALLAAYRVGARVSWRGLAGAAAGAGLSAESLVWFAELVFAYIDQLSAASVAGHADELALEDRVRQRHLERLGHGLVSGASEDVLVESARRASWTPPDSLVAVVLAEDRVDAVLARIDPRTLQPVEDIPGLPAGAAVLLVPDPGPRFDSGLRSGLAGAAAFLGPVRPWLSAHESFARAAHAWRCLAHEGVTRTDDVLPELILGADPGALADLRAQALAPLADLPPGTAARLAETLRSWLLNRGRRDEVAAELFVHPQTVRYRMGQVRALFGEALDDPRGVLALTIALAAPGGADRP